MFLNNRDLDNLSKWKYSVEDNSITTEYSTPSWRYLTGFMPISVAPNIISLVGLLCTLYSYYLCYYYLDSYPVLVPILSALLIFMYFNLDAVDGMHARKTNNGSPMGELFDHACDNITVVFLVLGVTIILGIFNPFSQWLITQSALLVFMLNHLEAFTNGVVKFGRYTGPGEVLMVNILIVFMRIFTDYSWLHDLYYVVFGESDKVFTYCYYLIFAYALIKISILRGHNETRNGLIIALLSHFVVSMMYLNVYIPETNVIISHGLIMTILASELIVSKMAKRELHPLVPVFIMISLSHYLLCIGLCVLYYVAIFYEISSGLNIPLFNPRRNVFCNGVYDLLHVGHMNLFKTASSYGNRLVVGVHDDAAVESYKRKPIMTHEERCLAVAASKYVDIVIPNCPLYLTKEFINTYKIHVVVCSEEYNKPDDLYYKAARELGILQVLPRTESISTTELINRIKNIK
jgi:cytidyltransferase-like protein